jgi:hypothetical protein
LSPGLEEQLHAACDALRVVASSAAEDVLDPREAATRALANIAERFGRTF